MKRHAAVVFLILLVAGSSAVVGRLLACGYSTPALIMVNAVWPADEAAFRQGRVGVVQPTYAREYLAKAYRRFTGIAPAVDAQRRRSARARQEIVGEWIHERVRVLGTAERIDVNTFMTWRPTDDYSYYLNCTDDALVTATATLRARAAELGPSSAEVRDWLQAQEQVFANCGESKEPVVPSAMPATASAASRADRAYQIAAAHFYAGHFGEAEARFRAIADDARSPWRDYGRYLAARCLIRQATIVERDEARATELLKRAERELRAVVADRTLGRVRGAARRLSGFVTVRVDPIRRLHELSARLASSPDVSDQDYIDFVWLMDGFLSRSTSYPYDTIASRDELTANDDLVDWILAMQGTGEQAAARAVERWQRTHTLPWLVAALWKVAPDAAETPMLLEAAAQIPRESPAHQTVAFLSIRLLTARNDRNRSREILRTVSTTPDDRTPAEAANLFRAQALLLVSSLDELLMSVGRMPVASGWSYGLRDERDIAKYDKPSIDFDGIIVLSERLPLARLVEALQSPAMPPRLQWRVAAMTFTRAVMLRDDAAGLASATVLRSAFPKLAPEFDGYINASDAEARHRAGILTMVRHPDIKAFVNAEDDDTYADVPSDDVPDDDRPSWWCGFGTNPTTGLSGVYGSPSIVTPLPQLTSLSTSLPPPEFLGAADRRALESEFASLSSLGPGANYLLRETVRWASERPSDPQAAEALSRAIRGTRWGCGDAETAAHARGAFRVLHTTFARSDWAKRTKYWYDPARR